MKHEMEESTGGVALKQHKVKELKKFNSRKVGKN
jgi:hypothetical protein